MTRWLRCEQQQAKEFTMATNMNALHPPTRAWRRGRRVLRWIGTGLAVVVGLIVVLALVGAMYESAADED